MEAEQACVPIVVASSTVAADTFEIIQGITTPSLEIVLVDDDDIDDAPDLDGATVTMLWELPDGTTQEVPMTVVDAVERVVRRAFSPGDTDMVGVHRGQVKIVKSGVTNIWPPDGSQAIWFVNPRNGGL